MKEGGPKIPRPDSAQAALERRFSKTVLHAAQRDRKPLFEKLTSQNPFAVKELMEKPPRFAEYDRNAETSISLDETIASGLPKAFFANPTKWIESQPILKRTDLIQTQGQRAPTNEDLWREPYDASRVRSFDVQTGPKQRLGIISKRINEKSPQEISRAREAYEHGIPTPKVLAEISDKGNRYAWFERIDGHNLVEVAFMARKLLEPAPFLDNIDPKEHGDFSLLTPETIKKIGALMEATEKERLTYSLLRTNWNSYRTFENPYDEKISEYEKRFLSYLTEDLNTLKTRSPDQYALFAKDLKQLPRYLQEDADWIKERGHRIWLRIHLERINDSLDERRSAFEAAWESIMHQDPKLRILTSDVKQETERLQQLCEEKGIPHKDFGERNLLLAWDKKTNEPVIENGHPRILVLDWE